MKVAERNSPGRHCCASLEAKIKKRKANEPLEVFVCIPVFDQMAMVELLVYFRRSQLQARKLIGPWP